MQVSVGSVIVPGNSKLPKLFAFWLQILVRMARCLLILCIVTLSNIELAPAVSILSNEISFTLLCVLYCT